MSDGTNERVRLNYGELFAIHAALSMPSIGVDGRELVKTDEEKSALRKVTFAMERDEARSVIPFMVDALTGERIER